MNQLFESIEKYEKAHSAPSWDEDAKRYLALVALQRTLAGTEAGEVAARRTNFLKTRLRGLEFLPGYNSPTRFAPK